MDKAGADLSEAGPFFLLEAWKRRARKTGWARTTFHIKWKS